MDDIEKLKKLLQHWLEHNNGHTETYRIWADKISDNEKLSEILKRLYNASKGLNSLLEEAISTINR